jgi:hypothetical protein
MKIGYSLGPEARSYNFRTPRMLAQKASKVGFYSVFTQCLLSVYSVFTRVVGVDFSHLNPFTAGITQLPVCQRVHMLNTFDLKS